MLVTERLVLRIHQRNNLPRASDSEIDFGT